MEAMGNYTTYGTQQLLTMIGVVFLIFAAFVLWILYERYKNKKFLMNRIRREWGQEPDRDYNPTEYECISHYYLNKETDAFQIDDITWNDLDMDRVFRQLNHTRSFIGESYLYYQLRTPKMNRKELEEFEAMVSWMETHPKERENLEYFFAKIGRTGNRSIFDYVYNISNVKCGSNLIHYAVIGMLLAAIAVLLTNPQPGILLLITGMAISMWTYEKCKRPIAPYIISCVAIEKVLQAAEKMEKLELYGVSKTELRNAVNAFKKLRRNMVLLMAGDSSDMGIEKMLILYLNNLLHIDLIQFKTVVREINSHMKEFEYLIDTIGGLESAIAVASWRELHPKHAVPVLYERERDSKPESSTITTAERKVKESNAKEKSAVSTASISSRMEADLAKERESNVGVSAVSPVYFRAENMYHPLIASPVANSLDTDQCVLLTGSNASGKSTFLKTAALQTILAQTVHTVTADSYEACFFRTFSSMALRDDLIGEESYYMVEIRSLKRILDRICEEKAEVSSFIPIFCCVDEVLRGTNTVERISASSQILKRMAQEKMICLAATHDIELTYLLEGIYRNCHFEEEITDDSIRFDYRLKEGRAMTRNAIRLLKLMGFEEKITREAEKMAEKMAASGNHE